MDDWFRWFQCPDCGGRMLSVGRTVGHWLTSQERACFQRQTSSRSPLFRWSARL